MSSRVGVDSSSGGVAVLERVSRVDWAEATGTALPAAQPRPIRQRTSRPQHEVLLRRPEPVARDVAVRIEFEAARARSRDFATRFRSAAHALRFSLTPALIVVDATVLLYDLARLAEVFT